MPASLVKDQEHDYDHLALYVQELGFLKDALKVEYILWDDSTGTPGRILPASGRTEVTTTGKFATGCYGIYDPATTKAWKPTSTYKRGRVQWFFTINAGEAEQLVERGFEVVSGTTQARLNLTLVQDLRDNGLTTSVSDLKAWALCLRWTELLERVARQRFRAIREALRFRGEGGTILFLGEPLFGMTSLTSATTKISNVALRIHGSTGAQRRNPKVEYASEELDIFAVVTAGYFVENIVHSIDGVWGFLEEDTLEGPVEIKEAAILGAVETATTSSGSGSVPGPVKREKTDAHEIEYAVDSGSGRVGLLSILRDPVIRDAISLYRAPMGIAAGAH